MTEISFRSAAVSNGTVELALTDGAHTITVGLEPAKLAVLVSELLLSAQKAMALAKQAPYGLNEAVPGLVGINPDRIGITLDTASGKVALVVHAGRCRVGVGLAQPEQFAQALLAASASTAAPQ